MMVPGEFFYICVLNKAQYLQFWRESGVYICSRLVYNGIV